MYNKNKLPKALFAILPALAVGTTQAEGFLADSKANLQLQNYYFNRDFREASGQSKREEWAQGFILDWRSGYTPGAVGFGVDAMAMLGVKLDSGKGRAGSGLLPVHDDGEAADEFSRLGATFKARAGDSELRYGTLVPKLPTVQANTGRILPQTFEGGLLSVREIDGLTLTLARLDQVTERDSTDRTDLSLNNKNRRFAATAEGDDFRIAGADLKLPRDLLFSYQYGQLRDVYDQHFVGLGHSLALGAGKLKSDLRYSRSGEAGSARGGRIDSDAFGALFTYSLAGHALGLGWQKLAGDTSMPYLNGTDPYLVNYIQINDFAEPGERSWQLRYDYDFTALGVPGLTFMSRYVRGDHAEAATQAGEGREWERNTDLQYVIQGGPLKSLAIRWRNASYRSSFARDADENRLILTYSLPLR
ncbi:OprD family porin [Pseudomonas sp. GCM10022188]|uniref:OprD family porin n=1 Tax=Pseudomonas TaxID=286 RepID=UPI001E63C926|nr:OprD family porin [Pseudomonas oryzagri]MCC6076539.1 OprD family porin [Pseudomonas oryzagri]